MVTIPTRYSLLLPPSGSQATWLLVFIWLFYNISVNFGEFQILKNHLEGVLSDMKGVCVLQQAIALEQTEECSAMLNMLLMKKSCCFYLLLFILLPYTRIQTSAGAASYRPFALYVAFCSPLGSYTLIDTYSICTYCT